MVGRHSSEKENPHTEDRIHGVGFTIGTGVTTNLLVFLAEASERLVKQRIIFL